MLAPNVRLPAGPSSSTSAAASASSSTAAAAAAAAASRSLHHQHQHAPPSSSVSASSFTSAAAAGAHLQPQQHNKTSQQHPARQLLCQPPPSAAPQQQVPGAGPLISAAAAAAAGDQHQSNLANSLPHQLSQLCSSQQYQLLALQQNFNHLLPGRSTSNNSGFTTPTSTPATTSTNSTPAPAPHHHHHHHHQHHAGAPSSSSSASLSARNHHNHHQHQPPCPSFLSALTSTPSSTMNNNNNNNNLQPPPNHRHSHPQDSTSNYRYNPAPTVSANHHNHHHHHHHSHNPGTSSGPSSSAAGCGTSSGTSRHHNLNLEGQFSAPNTSNSNSANHSHHNHHHHHHHHHLNHHMNTSQSNSNNSFPLNDFDSAHLSTTNNNSRAHHIWRKSKTSNIKGNKNNNNLKEHAMVASGEPFSLLDLSAKVVAEHIPFQSIELRYDHIPEPVQRRIIFWSFPRHEDDIKMYSSLSSDTFSTNGQVGTSASGNSNVNNSNNATQPPSSMRLFPLWDAAHGQPPPPPPPPPPQVQQQQHPQQADNLQNNPTNSNSTNVSPSFKNSQQLTFHKGLRLYNEGRVHDVLQVGFNLTGSVAIKILPTANLPTTNSRARGNNNNSNNNNNANQDNQHHHNDVPANHNNRNPSSINDISSTSQNDSSTIKHYRVSVTFDRCKITSVSCSCDLQDIFWCEHVVALILYRIRNPDTIELRVPISETLLSLDRQQLQKLVQYIIAEHHTEVLPTAQRLLDEMRQSYSEINRIQGAPDPTAGACADDDHIWHLDEYQVNDKVHGYLNLVSNNSKEAIKQIVALFEKIREMFRAKDSNGIRLLKLITEQFLQNATRNDKSRPLWDQLVSLWVVVMLNPDLPKSDKNEFIRQLNIWSKVAKCPKEDVERRISTKRKAAELSDDEDGEDFPFYCGGEYSMSYNQSNNYPAHMATHRHRSFQPNNSFPVLRPYNQLPILPPSCPCQLSNPFAKKMRSHHFQQNNEQSSFSSSGLRHSKSSSSLSSHSHQSRGSGHSSSNENRPVVPQEPRSIFSRALDFQSFTWNDSHLQLVLNRDGPITAVEPSQESNLFDFTGNPLWSEGVPQAAARVETLRSHGYRDQALKLAVAAVRRLKLQQDQWCHAFASESNQDGPCVTKSFDHEAWLGHPADPINVLMDILLEASHNDAGSPSNPPHGNDGICTINSARCSCPYNQALADFTHRLLPDLASLPYQHRVDGFPILPLVNLAQRRQPTSPNHNSEKSAYHHVTVPGCCQKDSYLTLAFEIALIALGQQRSVPTTATAHERAVRQESELISKLGSIDTTDPILVGILKHQTTLLLEGGPFQSACCGIATDSAPLHTFSRYLFDSLLPHYPQLAYKVGVYALKMPLVTDENTENFGAARTSQRSINHNHLQTEQLALAQTMLSKARDETQQGLCLRKVYRASVKTIRNPAILLKLSKHVLKEARPSGTIVYPALLKTSFDLGLQVLKATQSPHTSNSKVRREAIQFIVECATDIGLEAVLQIMKDSRDYFSAIEALNLVVAPHTLTSEQVNIRLLASSKLKLNENPMREMELNRRSRDLALECADRDPTNCALEALKFCETDDEALTKALLIVIAAGANRKMDSTLLIKVADYIHDKGMTDKAFELALVAVDSLTIPSNSDNSSSKKDIFSACEYAQRVNGFSTLIPKLINNIECATVLSDIYDKFSPNLLMASGYRNYGDGGLAYKRNLSYNKEYNDILNSLNPELYKQRVEDARWWAALLKKTLKAFVDTTRTRLQNISPRHYGEFIDFLIKAQGTFEKAADGPQQFKDLIFEIIKSYRTKKKLMERLKLQFKKSIETG